MTSESLKKSNTTIKKPSLFITLNKTPSGYIIANNIHANVQHQHTLSKSTTVNQQENSYAHQADAPVQRDGNFFSCY